MEVVFAIRCGAHLLRIIIVPGIATQWVLSTRLEGHLMSIIFR